MTSFRDPLTAFGFFLLALFRRRPRPALPADDTPAQFAALQAELRRRLEGGDG